MNDQPRQPAGSPDGGQFANTEGAESASTLDAPAPRPTITKPRMANIATVQVGDVFADGEFRRHEWVKSVVDMGDHIHVTTDATVALDAGPYRFPKGHEVYVIQPRPADGTAPTTEETS